METLNEPAGFWQEGWLQAPVKLIVPTLLRPRFPVPAARAAL